MAVDVLVDYYVKYLTDEKVPIIKVGLFFPAVTMIATKKFGNEVDCRVLMQLHIYNQVKLIVYEPQYKPVTPHYTFYICTPNRFFTQKRYVYDSSESCTRNMSSLYDVASLEM